MIKLAALALPKLRLVDKEDPVMITGASEC
jgi:hypothetical protein